MKSDSKDFLLDLLATPSPSGFEQEIQQVVRERMEDYADEMETDLHGNLKVVYNPEAPIRVMLAGHCDQIGMMITHIDDKGYLYIRQIGGIDPAVLPGSKVIIHNERGPVEGIIGHKAVHLLTQAERGKKVEISKVWIDIGCSSKAEANKKVALADPITYDLNVTQLGKQRIASPACDDKVGVFVVMEALRLVHSALGKKKKGKFPVALYAVSTVQEEIGLRGARTSCYGIDPTVGIAVDVTHASDCPGVDPKKVGTVHLGKGPTISKGANVNPRIGELLVKTAKKKNLKYQLLATPGATGTDANAMQITRQGVAAALIGIPNRYMHTQVELVDLRDLETAAKLIAETVLQITAKTSFIP